MNKQTLLFDLGGVIVPWVGIDELAKLTQTTREDVNARLATSDVFHAYERGLCDNDTFLKDIISLFNLNTGPNDFAVLWNSWVWAPYPYILAALKELREYYMLACLSNNNALHWAHLKTLLDVDELFDFIFASHLIQAAKPDVESYHIPLEAMGVQPQDVLFFDDTMDNIDTAKQLGITCHHVNRDLGVMPILRSLGLLSS